MMTGHSNDIATLILHKTNIKYISCSWKDVHANRRNSLYERLFFHSF